MIVTTTSAIQGYSIQEYKGIVKGLVVLTPTFGQSMNATFKNLMGGQIKSFTEMCLKARQEAYDKMIEEAKALRADAVVGMVYDSSEMVFGNNSAIEILCYGTAVVFENGEESASSEGETVSQETPSLIIDKEV